MDDRGVIDQMLLAGLECPPLPLDLTGKIRRFGRKRNSWYRLSELRTDAGRSVVVGSFGDWRMGLSERVSVDWRGINEADREAMRARQAAQAAAADAERKRAAELASMSAGDLWAQGRTDAGSAYLARKGGLIGESCRMLPDGSMLIPLMRYDLPREQALRAVQRIWPDGRKRFTKGFEKPGCALRLGQVEDGEPILLAEGYATALSLRMATGHAVPVVVCLDAGNLRHVAELLRRLWPAHRLLICADDDWRTTGPDGAPLNVGRAKAAEVAKALPGVDVVYPVWRGQREAGDTDFNDLHIREGLASVRRQVGWVLQAIRSKQVPHA